MSEKRTLPVLPLRGLVVYPHMMVNVDVGRDRSVAATERAIAGSNEVLVVAQRDPDAEDPTESDLYTVKTMPRRMFQSMRKKRAHRSPRMWKHLRTVFLISSKSG